MKPVFIFNQREQGIAMLKRLKEVFSKIQQPHMVQQII